MPVPAAEQHVGRSLCVSIHDVAPATWPDCLRLWRALRAVADIPLTWLVVPCYHGRCGGAPPCAMPAYETALEQVLAQGHELALHGYTHLDHGPPPRTLSEAYWRRVFTQSEGEFAALSVRQAQHRLDLGIACFARRGWPLYGFVAPAWLLSDGAWAALRNSRFVYTTTLRHFHLLRERPLALPATSLMYSTRNAAGRLLSPVAVSAAAQRTTAPLVRLSLHPRDARHPALLRHLQRTVAALLTTHAPLTKADFAKRAIFDCGL
jgi:predicted deacetylase